MKKIITGRILGFIPFRGTVREGHRYPAHLRIAMKLQTLLDPDAAVTVTPLAAA